jgi:hypothetical protein
MADGPGHECGLFCSHLLIFRIQPDAASRTGARQASSLRRHEEASRAHHVSEVVREV